jgi:LysM repeat protein
MDGHASRSMARTLVAAGAGLALLAACSSGGGGGSASTSTTPSTAFSTIPIATTTTVPAAAGQTPDSSATGGGGTAADGATHTVVSGDYLLGIAKKLGVPLQSLLDANGMSATSLITPGQKLKIPAATTGSTTATTAGSGGGTATSAAATTTTTVADAPGTYTVRPNDGWSIIANRLGVDAADLAAFNDLTLNSVLIPGQKLRIPPARATTTTAKG